MKGFLLLYFEGVFIPVKTEIIIKIIIKILILHDAFIFSLIQELCIFFGSEGACKCILKGSVPPSLPGESNRFSTFSTEKI